MNPDLDTLATSLYVTVDDLLAESPHWAPERPAVGIVPRLSDAEPITLAVIQWLLRVDCDPSLAGQGVWWEVIGVLTWVFVL